MPDEIHIEELAVDARIGVPEDERSKAQRLLFSITLVPRTDFSALEDDVQNAVDYAAVADEVRGFTTSCVVRLIETLADEIAIHLLQTFPLREVRIELRKFILPGTAYVAARVTRTR